MENWNCSNIIKKKKQRNKIWREWSFGLLYQVNTCPVKMLAEGKGKREWAVDKGSYDCQFKLYGKLISFRNEGIFPKTLHENTSWL